MRIIDLSVPIDEAVREMLPPRIRYEGHVAGAQGAARAFGLEPSDFPDGMAWAVESIQLSTHTGTHVDAPWHYGPTSAGQPAPTIDQMPLEWFYGDGVVLDFHDRKTGELITEQDVRGALDRIDYRIKPGDIVLIRTGADRRLYEADYEQCHAGMSKEATEWLVDQGVRVMGIDAWGWDRPFSVMAEEYKRGIKDNLWAGHFVGKKKPYCHIEKLANLDKLPRPYGFKVAAFPVKIARASAGWARVVAIVEDA